ncbi:dnaJ homolog subfamily C member 11 isoform X6 [Musca domestica]|uniref:DnaJ homolog subfamily C member 11 isoform X6 n=2 Tax=Musca domestica TaxID=7370 RepID=A0A1I8M1N1_MUSDO|nr:dnaJ homolog subfamily C member 11 isoform X6 [Musca domestica]XP_058987132.1 dnaJ homolog subfamily C member 11 isoform X6 [Musca domestica]XP_058987133.1 dnaJ homolog subfamily C member 11 isoform X6 [Musca domestica]XP_058987134.1 dnaJ homolog subfamily C member 11 isoform X6 [Musca domestica]XP_058987135.1 dnaJ homolog subfamily C member 11 isoform X6 [Musca domestica]XP_058987136.1 dnaJ homolog subfamily C member 11 isoform X6 [Musca domestica]XP_058987137.1 dnaJ homolog subfamily C m
MSDEIDSDNELEENYYSYLNVPKEASAEQINNAYRKLSRLYHPDKHTEPENKQKAELMFNRTKKAYEVLSDPHKRAIYDSVGEKGLRTDGWELVQRQKTPAEIREEYERLAEAAEARKLLQNTNPRGNVIINVNATEIFSPYDESDFPRIEVSSMSIAQSIEAPLTRRDTLTLSGNLMSSNGNGSGGFVVCGRRLLNKGWLELDVGAGNGLLVGVKGGRTLSSLVTLNAGASTNFRDNGVIPGLFTTLGVQLDKHTLGSLTLNAGGQASMTTQIDRNTERYAWSTSFVIGSPHIYFSIAYTHKMIENELKLKAVAKVGTFGFMAEYGAEKKISKYSSVLAAVSIGVPTGVILKFKVIRSQQTYVFPIHLSEEIVPAAVFYATVTPIIVWFFVKKSIIEPMQAERKNIEIEKTKRTNEQRMNQKRQEAMAALDLMQHTYERIVQEETERQGLIIVKATYGQTEEDNQNEFIKEASIDVTIPVQCLVKDGVLELYNSSKSDLPGFYDPCIGEAKILRIDYLHNNVNKSIVVKDIEAVRLPR